ncbi:MAG: hypothetical protein J6O49_13135 [Bacteroidaceae bacterium]|nr:hypothetical protein [Bacteroidaceae bacterium]MBP3732594.1 hypothetical protein [Bacilli bacterium]
MSQLSYIINKDQERILPITHERAVRDDDGTTLETKMQTLSAAILSTSQTLTAAQKAQARENIGAAADALLAPYYDANYEALVYPVLSDVSYDSEDETLIIS